jgi:hypothetical protein
VTTDLPLHPRHGIHAPTEGTPARVPGSVRRTSSIDCVRPEGAWGPVQIHARARDIGTRANGDAVVLAEIALRIVVEPEGSQILEITSQPELDGLQLLVGHSAHHGFRGLVARQLADLTAAPTPLALLLDDLPGTILVSTIARNRLDPATRTRDLASTLQPDICSGWRVGGTVMLEFEHANSVPLVTGPYARSLETEDADAWHSMRVQGPHETRRMRRIDVLPGHPTPVDVFFRDSHVDEAMRLIAVHEYTVEATVSEGKFASVTAEPRVLPWLECPHAASSATRLVGTPYDDLRQRIRADFTGRDTCTHLNDTLRNLQDLVTLLPTQVEFARHEG